jgi:hypothetical protein
MKAAPGSAMTLIRVQGDDWPSREAVKQCAPDPSRLCAKSPSFWIASPLRSSQ